MSLPEGYTLRLATAEDAPDIATQRAQMFVAMGQLDEPAAQSQVELWNHWLRSAIPAGDYQGFVVEQGGQPVGSVGMLFHCKFPTSEDPATLRVYVLNMYVAPEHRRRGLAQALMAAVMERARARGLRSLSLHGAPMGQGLYERLGFKASFHPQLLLTLDDPA